MNTNDLRKQDLTILHIACLVLKHSDIAFKLILKEVSSELDFIELKSRADRTALMIACQKGSLESVKILFSLGASIKTNSNCGNCLILGAEAGSSEIIDWLI